MQSRLLQGHLQDSLVWRESDGESQTTHQLDISATLQQRVPGCLQLPVLVGIASGGLQISVCQGVLKPTD